MIEIAICDDDIPMTTQIESLIVSLSEKHNIAVKCSVFFNGLSLLKSIQDGNHYEIIYLDVEMPELDGTSAAKAIREINFFVLLIYVSGHDQHLSELFETEPFRFVSKPIDPEYFESVFLKACHRLHTPLEFFTFQSGKSLHHIPLKDILFFKSSGRVISITTIDSVFSFYEKMNLLEKQLTDNQCPFIRIHQSYLVNYNYIKKITRTSITLLNDRLLPISDDRQKTVLNKFCEVMHMGVS